MKTSELKKIVEENGFRLVESDVRYCVVNENYTMYADIIKTVQDDFRVQRWCPKVIAKAILEYAYTPLEEREEEKKYYLKFPKEFIFSEEKAYLNVHTLILKCAIGDAGDCPQVRTVFTQKEIDKMPFDTKFFQKVEVK